MRFYRSVNIMAKPILTPAEIGEIIRTARKAAGLRQDQLAGAAGVGLRFIVDVEAGKPTAQIGKVLEVLQALGCSIRYHRATGTQSTAEGMTTRALDIWWDDRLVGHRLSA